MVPITRAIRTKIHNRQVKFLNFDKWLWCSFSFAVETASKLTFINLILEHSNLFKTDRQCKITEFKDEILIEDDIIIEDC
jgi:hypothetical protein